MAETRDVVSGIVSTGLAVGPDGAIYINDWLETYDKKPVGRIWKLDVETKDLPQRQKTQEVLANGMGSRSIQELTEFLSDEDMRVRLEAQFELVDRNARSELLEVLDNDAKEMGAIHAVWGLGQLARKDQAVCADLFPFMTQQIHTK